tara:strand:+ start:2034 stop:2228 length:195 start_codon:yes stop_codon:yes gene_type:complete
MESKYKDIVVEATRLGAFDLIDLCELSEGEMEGFLEFGDYENYDEASLKSKALNYVLKTRMKLN